MSPSVGGDGEDGNGPGGDGAGSTEAEEVSQMTKWQILQQAGTAMLAQANSAPQSILSLLR